MVNPRHARQQRLAQVGSAGQARIEALVVQVEQHPGATWERRYLERAGAQIAAPTAASPTTPFAHAEVFKHAVSAALGEGTWRALQRLRRALDDREGS